MRYYPRRQELPPKAPRYPGWAKSSTEHTALITRVSSCVSVDGTHVKGFWVHTTLIDRPVEPFDSHRKLPAPQLYRLTGSGQRIQAISFTCIDDHIPRGNVFRSVVVLLEVFCSDFYFFFPIQFLFVSYSMAITPCRFETYLNIC